MKLVKTLVIFLVVFSSFTISKKAFKSHSFSSKHKTKESSSQLEKVMTKVETAPQHISEIMYGGPVNNIIKDKSFLWNHQKTNLERPFYNGIVGSQFKYDDHIPNKAIRHISSNVEEAHEDSSKTRIIPSDLNERTISASAYDLPNKRDVIQVNLPLSKKTETTTYVDPRRPKMEVVETSNEILHHNLGSTHIQPSENAINFAEKKSKKKNNKSSIDNLTNQNNDQIDNLSEKAIDHAHNAEETARKLLKRISSNNSDGKYVMKIESMNKREIPTNFQIRKANKQLQKNRMNSEESVTSVIARANKSSLH